MRGSVKDYYLFLKLVHCFYKVPCKWFVLCMKALTLGTVGCIQIYVHCKLERHHLLKAKVKKKKTP